MQKIWSHRGYIAYLLWPLAQLYRFLTNVRCWLYKKAFFTSQHPGRPVIVVGNVVAGGAGKTPVVIQLVQYLQSQGLQPGVISRGYGRSTSDCREVGATSPPDIVGDEPALIARRCRAPVFVAKQRMTAAKALLTAYPQTDVIVCDDGLQHHALQRDIELCVFHSDGIGNGWPLPAGPLRESWPRAVDAVLFAGNAPPAMLPACAETEAPQAFQVVRTLSTYAVNGHGQRIELQQLGSQTLHAIAAIARPSDFFSMLQQLGLHLQRTTALPDHYDFNSLNMIKDERETIICTEKDAIKLWPTHPAAWAVGLETQLPITFYDWLLQRLSKCDNPPLALIRSQPH